MYTFAVFFLCFFAYFAIWTNKQVSYEHYIVSFIIKHSCWNMFTFLEKSYTHLYPFICLHVFAKFKHVTTSKVWIQYDQSQ